MVLNKVEHTDNLVVDNVPTASGIDTLYYFAESNSEYEEFLIELLSQIEKQRERFKSLGHQYQDNEIVVLINDIEFVYTGSGRDGFEWFKSEYVRLGFKDREKNKNLHNIRVQLDAIGIYTIGIKSLLEYVNTKILDNITTGHFPITRVDLNSFVQHDFKYVHEDMWVSKKQSYDEIYKTHGKIRKRETITIGKSPFKLRVYDKLAELAHSKKKELMHNYFGINGLDIEKPISNVEFEMHREFLKEYGIDTVDDVLNRSVVLFNHAMDAIRLIDLNSIKEEQLKSSNRNRALTLPIWEHIKQRYSLDEFFQTETPLNKIESISYHITLEDMQPKIVRILKRLKVHGVTPTISFLSDCLRYANEQYENSIYFAKQDEDTNEFKAVSDIPVIYEYDEEYSLTQRDKSELLRARREFAISVKEYSDEQITNRLSNLESILNRAEERGRNESTLTYAYEEMFALRVELNNRDISDSEIDVF